MRFLLAFAQGGLLSPLLPLLRETFHVSHGELGLLTSMFGLSCVVMDIIATYLLRRRPLLRVLLLGIILTAIGLICCTLAPGFYWLVGARVLLGLGVSMTGVASLMAIVVATPRTAQGRASSLLEFAAIAGSAISPTCAGLVASLMHWRAACGLATVFVAGAFVWVLCTRQALDKATGSAATGQHSDTHPGAPPVRPGAEPSTKVEAKRTALIAYLASFVLSFTWAGFLSTALPLFGGEVVGLPVATLGLVFTAGLLVDLALLLPIGWLSDRLEYRVVLTPAMLLMAATLLWLPQAQNFTSLLLVSICLHTGFAAWGMPSAALALCTRGEHLVRVMGIYRLLVDGAVVIAPWWIGTLIGRYGYGFPSRCTAVVVALTALLVALGLRPARRG
jgi:MFS family permease